MSRALSYPRVGIGVFIWQNKKFIIGKRKGSHGDGTWTLPGGHLEFGETIEQAAKREAAEEVGVRIKNIKILAVTNDVFKKENKHYVTVWVKKRPCRRYDENTGTG